MKDKVLFGTTLTIILVLMGLLAVMDMGRNQLEKRISSLEIDLKVCQGHKEVNWANYKACQKNLEKCKERKSLAERLKSMTLQDVIEDVQEIDQMVKAFVKKQKRP